MKKDFNFENFYLYEGNRIAYLAARKIVQDPVEIFNPFYVYGGCGLGKTHLLRAIHTAPDKKFPTLFFTGKEFEKHLEETREFSTPIIIDDVHTIGQTYHGIFLEIIDILLANNKQLCFSGNAAPRDLKNFNAKLISRLESGLVCDIQSPKELALIEVIKRKAEERGIILLDDIALELAQLSAGSFRTVEGMINRLSAYASLGNFTLDRNSLRIILKEFYPQGIYRPVSSLLEELKKSVTEVLKEVTEKIDPREEYKEKIYIWEMKGFDTTSLKSFLDSDIETLANEYQLFIKKVERLVELQKEFGTLDTSNFPVEALKIETMLFLPDKINEIERLLEKIKSEVAERRPTRTFETFLIGESNKAIYELYRNTILPSLGQKFNPFIVIGGAGTGKTHFLEAMYNDLKNRDKSLLFCDFKKPNSIPAEKLKDANVLLVDNFSQIFSASEDLRKEHFNIILDFVKNDKQVIIATDLFPDGLVLTDEEKLIFERGIEILLGTPSSDIVGSYIRSALGEQEADKLISRGLPLFTSFYEIDEYLQSLPAIQELPELQIVEEVVDLGLLGEERAEAEAPIEETAQGGEEKTEEITKIAEAVVMPLKTLNQDRLVIPEIAEELIEENY